MNYFQILGVGFGIAAFLKPFYMHLIPWDENKFIVTVYTKERPRWVVPVALLGLMLVGFTWYKEFTTEIRYSIVITIMFSLTAVKALIFISDYRKFQRWVDRMLNTENGKKIVVVDVFAGIFGLLLIVASLYLL